MNLSEAEIARYARHIVLHGVGGPGQNKLKVARVVAIGAGGLGSPALQYLAAAGVGALVVVDDDEVSLSNLQRQVLHGTPDLGRPKVESARDAIVRLNPHVDVLPLRERVTEANVDRVLADADIVLDGSDNFTTRYLVSDACCRLGKTLVTAALGEYDGTLTTLKPHRLGADGLPNPTYRCLFPEAPPAGTIPTCAEAGVLGALAGALGSLMALEAIREIVGGFSDGDVGLVGKLLMIDLRTPRFETMSYSWDEANRLTGRDTDMGKRLLSPKG